MSLRVFTFAVILAFPAWGASPGKESWVAFDTFRFQPIDEGERDKSFHDFRYKLSRALETRDTQGLLALVSREVRLRIHAKDSGLEAFVKEWKLDAKNPRESLIWDKLRDTVRLGGVFDQDRFVAPYVFARWPERFAHFDYYAVLNKNVKLRKSPDPEAQVVETLSQEVVGRFDEVPNPTGWKAVRAPSGRTGFVESLDVRSPNDYRAIFAKEKGQWKLTQFADGDWEEHERSE